jgi:hypothetical protein
MTTIDPRPQQIWIRYWPPDFPDLYEARVLAAEGDRVRITVTNGQGPVFPTGKELTWDLHTFVTLHTYVRDEATIHDRLLSGEPFRLKPEPARPPKTLHQRAIEEIQTEEDRQMFELLDLASVYYVPPPEPPDVWERLMEADDGWLV